jgi:hypothetical protein
MRLTTYIGIGIIGAAVTISTLTIVLASPDQVVVLQSPWKTRTINVALQQAPTVAPLRASRDSLLTFRRTADATSGNAVALVDLKDGTTSVLALRIPGASATHLNAVWRSHDNRLFAIGSYARPPATAATLMQFVRAPLTVAVDGGAAPYITNFIGVFDVDGRSQAVIDTADFEPLRGCSTDSDQIWAFGVSWNAELAPTPRNYAMLRSYDVSMPSGRPTGLYVPRSSVVHGAAMLNYQPRVHNGGAAFLTCTSHMADLLVTRAPRGSSGDLWAEADGDHATETELIVRMPRRLAASGVAVMGSHVIVSFVADTDDLTAPLDTKLPLKTLARWWKAVDAGVFELVRPSALSRAGWRRIDGPVDSTNAPAVIGLDGDSILLSHRDANSMVVSWRRLDVTNK